MIPSSSTYAIWYQRLFAYLLDAFILLLPSAFIIVMMGMTVTNGEWTPAPSSTLVVFLMNAAYYVFFTANNWQATPGMRLVGIRLVRTDGRRLSQRDALERYLALVLPTLPLNASFLPPAFAQNLAACLCILWFAPILTTRIGIHDRLCHLRVITGRTSA